MRTLYTVLFLLGSVLAAQAAPGDTTWVQANNVQLDYYNNFDTTVAFPNTSKTYRKIYMIFTLGKYVCPGNPQYCGDWDYTVQNYFMAKNAPDTFELGRFMTPYAHTGYGPFTANWTRRYIFDVTDYYPALHDTGTVRIHYSGYSGGFTANIKFAFIEGTPERNVVRVDRLWHGDFNYGHGTTPINSALAPMSKSIPANQSAVVKMNITGHGGDDNSCAEFCPNRYTLSYNGASLVQQAFFRPDCSMNDLYPQSGTWINARANWCPGDAVGSFTHALPAGAAGSAYTLGMSFPAYTSTTLKPNRFPASYTIDGALIFYGTSNRTTDASLEDIIAPTNAEYFTRENPTSLAPRLRVRNSGSAAITTMEIEYGVVGRASQTYTWQGSIAPFTNADVTLPALADLQLPSGDYQFRATIQKVNGAADQDALNNAQTSTFKAAPEWAQKLVVQMLGNGEASPFNTAVSQTAWRIYNAQGAIVAQRVDCTPTGMCADTFQLPAGAYRLVVSDSGYFGYYDIPTSGAVGVFMGTGLAGFSSANGYLRVYNGATGASISLPGAASGNFGGGFTQHFYVKGTASVAPVRNAASSLQVFPNPAGNDAYVVVDGPAATQGTVSILDMAGRVLATQSYKGGITSLQTKGLAGGVYHVVFSGADGATRLQQRLVLTR